MIKIITPAIDHPVTLAMAKAHLRVDADFDDDDQLIGVLINAAVQRGESETGRLFMPQVVGVTLPGFSREMHLPGVGYVRDVVSVQYVDRDGALQTVPVGDYRVLGENRLVPVYGKSWPRALPIADAVSVVVAAGWDSADAVPDAIKQWILLQVSTAYKQREAVVDGNQSSLPRPFVDGLLDPWRIY
jgi:uncharacterized phiE125 gp8 family phage protein